MATKAQYLELARSDHHNAVFIKDRNAGAMSVTNDAEAVVAELLAEYPRKRIIYLDTEGVWSELLHDDTKFMGFGPYEGWAPATRG